MKPEDTLQPPECEWCILVLGVSRVEINWSDGTWSCQTCDRGGQLPASVKLGVRRAK